MTLVPTDGVVGVIATLHKQSPEAAQTLYRLALYESLADQIDARRPEMEAIVLKNMADINAAARRTLLRSHVGKALDGQPEPDDLDYAQGLAVLDEYIEIRKDLTGALLAAFNRGVNRDDHGRFSRQPGRRNIGPVNIAHPGQEHRQEQAAVDLMGLTLHASQRQGDRMTANLFHDGQVKQNGDQIAGELYGRTEGVNRQAYNRMRVTGQALAGASNPGSLAHTVGSVAELAGNLGPEAEKVLGPGIRRTAYRYRGTERRPEQSVVSAVTEANDLVAAIDGTPEQQALAAGQLEAASRAKGKRDIVPQITAQWTGRNVTPDKRALSVRGDSAAAALLAVDGKRHESVLPDLDLVRLSLESGEMPPSQGVIIDSDGKVTSQAVGYNGDHYLPFDLRNLGSLHGGQYVRSRATGGPTTEDIYTGLLTGARQVQVVSNSGVFTIEFDPELRGGRRYNDKARRMVERYGAMLDTIGNPDSELFEPGGDLPPETLSALRNEAASASSTPQEFKLKYEKLRNKARMKAAFGDADMAEIDEAARNVGQQRAKAAFEQAARQGQSMSPQQRAQLANDEARNYKRDNQPTVRKLKLDGLGYNQAMKALKQEFPYFIRRADFQPLPEWMAQYGFNNPDLGYRSNAPSDLGYVQRGQTNTKLAQTGGRKVPNQRRRGSEETEDTAQTGTGAQNAQQQGRTPAATASSSDEPKKLTLADLAKPRSPLMKETGLSANVLLNAAASFEEEIAMDATEEYALGNYGPSVYLQWKAQKLRVEKGPARSGDAFTEWLLNEADPQQVETIRTALDRLPREREGTNKAAFDANDVPPADKLKEHADKVLTAYDLMHPFRPVPAGTDPHLVEPDTATMIPVQMPGVPAVDADDEVFEQAEANIGLGDEDVKAIKTKFAALNALEQAHEVNERYDQYTQDPKPEKEKILSDYQTVWSLAHAKALHEKVKPYLRTDADPKAPEPGEAAKRLRYDPPAEEFLLELRGRIDSLLEQP